jgi:hypothetical protein
MSLNDPKYQTTVVSTSVVGFVALFIIIIATLTYYTSTSGDYVLNNQQSEDKITVLNEAFRSALGPKWPYVILAFTIFVAIALYFLYIAAGNNAISINMSDTAANRFNIIFVYFTIIFGIVMIVLVVKEYLDYKKAQTGGSSNYIPTLDQAKKNNQLLVVIGLGLFVLFGGGYAVWYIFMKKKPAT